MFKKFLSLFKRKTKTISREEFERRYLEWFRKSRDKPSIPIKNYTFRYKPKGD